MMVESNSYSAVRNFQNLNTCMYIFLHDLQIEIEDLIRLEMYYFWKFWIIENTEIQDRDFKGTTGCGFFV